MAMTRMTSHSSDSPEILRSFMEADASFPYLQQPVAFPHPEAAQSVQYPLFYSVCLRFRHDKPFSVLCHNALYPISLIILDPNNIW
jgi:hypothetical protein